MSTSINDLMYALMDSNFDNIKANIEAIKRVFQDTYAIRMEIEYYFDANEFDVWVRTIKFKFIDAKNDELYTYRKAPAMINRSKSIAYKNYIKYKERYPYADVIWHESVFADKFP